MPEKKPEHAPGHTHHERAEAGFGVEHETVEGDEHVRPEGNLRAVEKDDLGGAFGGGGYDLVRMDAVLDHEAADLFFHLAGHGPDDDRSGADVHGLDGLQRRARKHNRSREHGAGGPSNGRYRGAAGETLPCFHALPVLREFD